MISENSIQEVRDKADLVEVIQNYTDLKKKGANYQGCCPFHDERTGSFTISPGKGIYKCYGCGAGGADAIKFMMQKERMDFPSAVKYLATKFNITLEETQPDPEAAEKIAQRADYLKINHRAAEMYDKMLFNVLKDAKHAVAIELLQNRKLTEETIITFQLGYAPDEWRYVTQVLVERGLFKPAEELGLVNTKNGSNYDMYRNRIMFPIHNERGEICGFGGRKMDNLKDDNPKYLNSRDSLLYKKDNLLYGLYQAAKHIRTMGFAVVVEGYYDVAGFHQTGMPNTVAPCGTAFTDNQAKILKKYTNHLVLIRDTDAAGMKANLKDVDMLLRHGFKVEICQLPEGEDPDSFSRQFEFSEEEEAA